MTAKEIEAQLLDKLVRCASADGGAATEKDATSAADVGALFDGMSFDFDLASSSEVGGQVDQGDLTCPSPNPFFAKPVDVWMADDVEALQFAVRMLSPNLRTGILPVGKGENDVAFLFVPLGENSDIKFPAQFSLADKNSEVLPICNIEDDLYGSGDGCRIIVMRTGRLRGRSTVIAQVRPEILNVDSDVGLFGAIRSFFQTSNSRWVYFLSPQPAQFGVLKRSALWDAIANEGKFHLVLCEPEKIKAGPTDCASPDKGAAINFKRFCDRFAPSAWSHICSQTVKKSLDKCQLLSELTTSLDEGPLGRLRSYRFPDLVPECVDTDVAKTIPGGVNIAILKAGLAMTEKVLEDMGKCADRGTVNGSLLTLGWDFLADVEVKAKKWETLVCMPEHCAEELRTAFCNVATHMLDKVTIADSGWMVALCEYLLFKTAVYAAKGLQQEMVCRVIKILNRVSKAKDSAEITFYLEMARGARDRSWVEAIYQRFVSRAAGVISVFKNHAAIKSALERFDAESPVCPQIYDESSYGKLLFWLNNRDVRLLLMSNAKWTRKIIDSYQEVLSKARIGHRCELAEVLAERLKKTSSFEGRGRDGTSVNVLLDRFVGAGCDQKCRQSFLKFASVSPRYLHRLADAFEC